MTRWARSSGSDDRPKILNHPTRAKLVWDVPLRIQEVRHVRYPCDTLALAAASAVKGGEAGTPAIKLCHVNPSHPNTKAAAVAGANQQ